LRQVEAHLPTENAARTDTGAIGLRNAVFPDIPEKLEVRSHVGIPGSTWAKVTCEKAAVRQARPAGPADFPCRGQSGRIAVTGQGTAIKEVESAPPSAILRPMGRRITHAFFDVTDTLLRVRGSVGEAYAALARAHGVDRHASTLQAAFKEAVRSIPQPVRPDLSARDIQQREWQWWSDVVARTFGGRKSFNDFDAFFEELFEHFRHAPAWEYEPHVLDTLERLQKRQVTIGIISDMDGRLHDILPGLDLDDTFAGVFLSFSTGFAKPDRRLFETACRDSGVDVDRALHIGDSWEKDVMGARNAGLHGVWYRPQGATDDEWPWVSDLLQLPDLVDRVAR
jgi:putative hydrolase of the HAD superfamily